MIWLLWFWDTKKDIFSPIRICSLCADRYSAMTLEIKKFFAFWFACIQPSKMSTETVRFSNYFLSKKVNVLFNLVWIFLLFTVIVQNLWEEVHRNWVFKICSMQTLYTDLLILWVEFLITIADQMCVCVWEHMCECMYTHIHSVFCFAWLKYSILLFRLIWTSYLFRFVGSLRNLRGGSTYPFSVLQRLINRRCQGFPSPVLYLIWIGRGKKNKIIATTMGSWACSCDSSKGTRRREQKSKNKPWRDFCRHRGG